MKEFRNNHQFKSFMKSESERLNIRISNVYSTFMARTILHRISNKNKNILIKGSSAEIAYLGLLVRAITDIDVAIENSYLDQLADIYGINNSDIFDMKLIKEPYRTRTGIYKFSNEMHYKESKTSIMMDLQEGYARLIEPRHIVMPKIFDGDEEFEIYAPSFEEYLAEKLCIIAESNKPDMLNTRVKDFYDIYQLHGGNYDADKLTDYFGEMLRLRNKVRIEDIKTSLLNPQFVSSHSNLWDRTSEKYDFLDKEIDLAGAVYYTRAVLRGKLQKYGMQMPDPIKRYEKK